MSRRWFRLLPAVALLAVVASGSCVSGSSQRATGGPLVQEWEASYKGPDDRGGAVSALMVGGEGNVYVTGWLGFGNLHEVQI
jgi:hypothetical protein